MNKFILVLFAIICGIFLVQLLEFASARTDKINIEYPKAPEYLNSDGTSFASDNVNYAKVNELESILFNKTYANQPLELRLARIERKMFGAVQNNTNFNNRLEKLINASSILTGKPGSPEYYAAKRALDMAANQNQSANQGMQNVSKVRNKLSNFASIFTSGQMTGYSPPVYDDPYIYAPGYSSTQTCPPYYGQNQTGQPYNNQFQYANVPQLPQYTNSGTRHNNGQHMNLFSNGGGDEFYDSRGGVQKNLGNTGGGMGVTILRD